MSYARHTGPDNPYGDPPSDVYVFLCTYGALECCGCRLTPRTPEQPFGLSVRVDTTDAMLEHLAEHQVAGDAVPESCIAGLGRDRDENDAFIAAKTPEEAPDA